MYEELNQKLASLYQGIQNYNDLEDKIKNLKIELTDLNRVETKYAVELDLELEDVDRLSRKSFTSLIYTVLGSREEKEYKEKEEAQAAQLKLDEVRRQIEEIKYKLSVLQGEKNKFESCEKEYTILYNQKFDQIKASNTPEAQRITIFEDNISTCESNIRELEEAISSGSLVLDRIIDVESSLNSAKGWGTWDMLGGGLVSDLAKHSHIDKAKAASRDVQDLLNDFHSELADININSSITIEIDGFTKFADFFFDGIFADWVVQSRITDSLDSVMNVRSKVEEILIRLEQLEENEQNKIMSLQENLKKFIIEL